MAGYRKQIKGDSNQANEIASHNPIQIILAGGSGIALVLVAASFVVAIAVWIGVVYHTVLVCIVFGAVGLSFVWYLSHVSRHVADTVTRILVHREEVKWARRVYVTESLMATDDPKVRVENAQQVSIQRQYPAPQIGSGDGWPLPRQDKNVMPRLDELFRDE